MDSENPVKIIFAIKSKKCYHYDENTARDVINHFNSASKNIMERNFPPNNGYHCQNCQYKNL